MVRLFMPDICKRRGGTAPDLDGTFADSWAERIRKIRDGSAIALARFQVRSC